MTSLGGGTPPSANAPPPADGPNVQVPPVLHVHMVPEQLQSPEQPAAKVEEVLPPQLSGRAAPRTTMNVTPRDTDQTDCDTFNLFGPSSQKGPGQRPSHGCRTRNVTSNSHAHRSGWRSSLELWEPREPSLAGKRATWSRLLPVAFLPCWWVAAVDAARKGRDQVTAVLRAGASWSSGSARGSSERARDAA
jgi:hypothetical protein